MLRICWIWTNLEIHEHQCCISCHPYRSIRKQNWPCHKNGQSQPRVISWTNIVIVKYPMLYTKFQGYQPLVYEKRFLKFFLPHMGMVRWSGNFEQIFIPHVPWRLHLVSKCWTTVNEWAWPWVVINCHVFIYLTISTNFHLIEFISFREVYSLSVIPYISKSDKIWPCCKIFQGQSRVII